MNTQKQQYNDHYPVLLKEVLSHLENGADKHYLDCTFGAGGYSRAILENFAGKLTAFDQDKYVMPFATKIKEQFGQRFHFVQDNFASASRHNLGLFDAVILDLGVSSMQLDTLERGFSFMRDGPLDMRMSNEGMSAKDVVNNMEEGALADIIFKYGEEQQSRRIAKFIVNARQAGEINTTMQLADIIKNAIGKGHFKKKIDPATKTFQAIRIYINKELEALEQLLADSKQLLKENGKLIVVSFHSLEDSIVKNFFKEHSEKKVARSKYSTLKPNMDPNLWLNIITKKPTTPSEQEIRENIRSRSAKMRVAQKRGDDDI